MDRHGYTTTITVGRPAHEAYQAINDVRAWWGAVDGETDTVGAQFVYEVEGIHYSKQLVSELVPAKRVVWHVTEARIEFVEDKDEWNDTEIRFELSERDGQ